MKKLQGKIARKKERKSTHDTNPFKIFSYFFLKFKPKNKISVTSYHILKENIHVFPLSKATYHKNSRKHY